MKPYLIQSFKNDLGETDHARLIGSRTGAERVIQVSGTEPVLCPKVNAVYDCGEVSVLTISSFPASGMFSVVFISGASPATLTIPQTLAMPDRFQVEANTRYEINVRDGYALCAGWAVNVS